MIRKMITAKITALWLLNFMLIGVFLVQLGNANANVAKANPLTRKSLSNRDLIGVMRKFLDELH